MDQHILMMSRLPGKIGNMNFLTYVTREGFLRKNIVAVSFFQNCAIHQYS